MACCGRRTHMCTCRFSSARAAAACSRASMGMGCSAIGGGRALSRAFLTALAAGGGGAGYGDRTAAMRALFADAVPLELLTRPRKAEFGRALWRSEARAFAASWDGTGVDDELVDPEQVRVAWSAPSPWFGAI